MKQSRNMKGTSATPPSPSNISPELPTAATTMAPSRRRPKIHPVEWALLPLRLFLGVTFVYAGIQKLTDPQFFNPRVIGYIGQQVTAFAHGSPIHNFLIDLVVPHAHFFGVLIILGEIAIGLGTLSGFLLRPASFFGMLLSLMFFLSASWHVYPYFYGADIVFVFSWLTLVLARPQYSVLPSLDVLLVPRYLSTLPPELQVNVGRISQVLLGIGNESVNDYAGGAMPVQGIYSPGVQGRMHQVPMSGPPQRVPHQVMNNQGRYQQGVSQQRQSSYKAQMAAQRRSRESRRNFLWGLTAGGLSMLIVAVAGRVLHIPPFVSDDAASPAQPVTDNAGSNGGVQPNTGSATPTGTGSSSTIAQVSSMPTNSAVTFTIPSNGDPGVLIHLNNGKFVCYDATCTHAGCPVSFDQSSSYLICPCHGAEFDPANHAAVVGGPAPSPLISVPININSSTGAITLQ